jgi:hypothetical protein
MTAELSLSVTKRRSGARGTRRDDGIGDLPSEAAANARLLLTSLLACVAACVAETPWTKTVARDGGRRRGSPRRVDARLHGLPGPSWTTAALLITQRSRVQIPPPLPGKTAPGTSLPGSFSATCDQTPGHIPRPIAGRFARGYRGGRRPLLVVLHQSDGLLLVGCNPGSPSSAACQRTRGHIEQPA